MSGISKIEFSHDQGASWKEFVSNGPPYEYGKDWFSGGYIEPESESIPESMCPNCRRDWHEVPLTETVARMWDSCRFDADYDPDADDSAVLCPGSECCGPARRSLSPLTHPGSWTYQYQEVFEYQEVFAGPSLVQKVNQKLFNMQEIWQIYGLDDLGIKADTWFPNWTYAGPTYDEASKSLEQLKSAVSTASEKSSWLPGFENIQQAAIEAAPNIDMEHKQPQPVGFDFSGWDGKPAYYTYMKKRRKK